MELLESLAIWFAISCFVALWIGLAIRNANHDAKSSDGSRDDPAHDDAEGAPLANQARNEPEPKL